MTIVPAGDRGGLTSAEAQARLKQYGPNAVVEEKAHPVKAFVRRFWAPIPWLLEATIIIQLFLGERVEAAVIGGLLVLNATLSLLQEGRAQRALALLRQQLRVLARVRRDGQWTTLSAEDLVPGDVVHLRQGTIVPADVRLEDGSLLVDQSALTGESAAASIESGRTAYAGSMVRGGEATGEVVATGARTFFGKTAELVRTADVCDVDPQFPGGCLSSARAWAFRAIATQPINDWKFAFGPGCNRASCAGRHSHAGAPPVIFPCRSVRRDCLLRRPRLAQGVALRPAEPALSATLEV